MRKGLRGAGVVSRRALRKVEVKVEGKREKSEGWRGKRGVIARINCVVLSSAAYSSHVARCRREAL